MSNKHLFFFGILLLSMAAVSGCAQKMAKHDDAAQPAAQPAQQEGDAQAKAVASEATATPQPAAAADTAATNAATATPAAAAPAKSGDASVQPSPTAATAGTAKDTAAAAALLPLPPKEIVDTIKKLTTHPRVRYLSRTAQYDYYVGGLIDAEYDINKNQLVVTNSPAKDTGAVTCEYSKDGNMINDKNSAPSQTVAECNKLINELTGLLAR